MTTRESVRALFPHIAAGVVHLNHAGSSPLNSLAIEQMHEFNLRQSADPAAAFAWCFEQWQQCRERLARMMGVPSDDLALTKNTAHGISIVANGLNWAVGDEVVFAGCEYPANSYPWLAQADRGVSHKVVAPRPDGTLALEDFAAQMTPRTRVIAVSWVQYSTGFRSDLKALADLAHSAGALLVVDVIQGLGAFPINLSALDVDAAATGSQKWLMGPMGVGGLYLSPGILAQMRLVNMGALSVKDVGAFNPLDLDVKPNAQRYEEGTPNLNGYVGLSASLGLIDEYGIENAAASILETTGYAAEQLEKRGYVIDSPMQTSVRSGILMFHHPTLPGDTIAKSLAESKINIAVRNGRLRFSPHLYTSAADIDRAVAALPKAD